MEKSSEYEYLINNIGKLLEDGYTYDELSDFGKDLPYRERLIYDYKVKCFREFTSFQESFAEVVYEKEFINKLIDNNELNYILDYFEQIVRGNYSFNDRLFNYLKDNKDKITNEEFDRISLTITKCIMESHNHSRRDINLLKDLLLAVTYEEKATLFDIRKIDDGAYAKVYSIKDAIIKIGFKILCKEIPNNSRILIPSIREMIGNDYVEITDRVITDENISIDEIYDIYKELREEKVLWLDPTAKNLGRLTPRAAKHMNSKRLCNGEHLGINKNINNIYNELEPGELVILDLDRLVFEDDKEMIEKIKSETNDLILSRSDMFEKRYKEENSLVKKIGTR